MKGLGVGKGIGSPYWAGLRPTQARPQNSTEKEKGAYTNNCKSKYKMRFNTMKIL